MNDSLSSIELLQAGLQNLAYQVLAYLPKIIAAIAVLILGWLLARLLSILVVRGMSRLDILWRRMITKSGQAEIQPRHPPTRMTGEMVFWLLMIIFVTLAGEILGLQIFATCMSLSLCKTRDNHAILATVMCQPCLSSATHQSGSRWQDDHALR